MIRSTFLLLLFLLPSLVVNSQKYKPEKIKAPHQENLNTEKMKIEIWSDVVCPFCYIGKRKFEAALSQLPFREDLEIEWKSYQLMPDMTTEVGKSVYEMLAEAKGISVQQSKEMHESVVQMAENVGLNYRFDIAIPANTYLAHQFLHFAKKSDKQNVAEELLFSAYFLEGKNIDDLETLIILGEKISLDTLALRNVLIQKSLSSAVEKDIQEAKEIGVRGVPFFVVDRKFGISGAQDVSVFLSTLEKAHKEWKTARSE
jgi:predicted DsbA family dithiol-disulfide isomerase